MVLCPCVSPVLTVPSALPEEAEHGLATGSLSRRRKALALREEGPRRRQHLHIGLPHDFRPVSSIIDVDILPETHRRVRLYRHGCQKPLGFYIRDGTSVRVAPQGLEKVPGIFISRLVPGGLAESTGLLAVDDEVLEVNGIEVAGKTLDQVTDMMIANSHNLIVTVKPANQRNNVLRGGRASGSSGRSSDSVASRHSLPAPRAARPAPRRHGERRGARRRARGHPGAPAGTTAARQPHPGQRCGPSTWIAGPGARGQRPQAAQLAALRPPPQPGAAPGRGGGTRPGRDPVVGRRPAASSPAPPPLGGGGRQLRFPNVHSRFKIRK